MKFVEPRELKTNERWSPKNLIFLWPKALGWCWWSTRPLYEVMGVSPFASNYWNLLLGRGNFHQLQHDSVEASCTDTMYNVYIYIYINYILTGFQVLGCFSCKKNPTLSPKMLLTSPGQDGAIVFHCSKGICIHMQLRDTFLQFAFNWGKGNTCPVRKTFWSHLI